MTAIVALDTVALGQRLKQFVAKDCESTVEFLLHLLELDNRRGYRVFNCATLWQFCTHELGLLDCATYRRTTCVKILRAWPQAAEYLRDGRLWMTTLAMLRDVLLEDGLSVRDAISLLDECARKSAKDVATIVVRFKPKAEVTTSLRALPAPRIHPEPEAPASPAPLPEPMAAAASATEAVEPRAPSLQLAAPIDMRKLEVSVRPIAPKKFGLNATVDQEFVDLLERTKNLLSHTIPTGNPVEVLRRSMQIACEWKEKEKYAKTSRPRAANATHPESISAETKRAIWERDGGCCAWRHPDGTVCQSRWMIEFDHVVPPNHGGDSTPANVRLLCDAHNEQHARDVYGDDLIDRKKKKRRKDLS